LAARNEELWGGMRESNPYPRFVTACDLMGQWVSDEKGNIYWRWGT
jgi:hypothetical protein